MAVNECTIPHIHDSRMHVHVCWLHGYSVSTALEKAFEKKKLLLRRESNLNANVNDCTE